MKNTVQKIKNKLTNSCKVTVELIDKKKFSKLTLLDKVKLKLHKSMCKTCNAYENRSNFLDKAIDKLYNQKQPHNKAKLSEERKSKILEKIKKQ